LTKSLTCLLGCGAFVFLDVDGGRERKQVYKGKRKRGWVKRVLEVQQLKSFFNMPSNLCEPFHALEK
jgi:hypothetical protein